MYILALLACAATVSAAAWASQMCAYRRRVTAAALDLAPTWLTLTPKGRADYVAGVLREPDARARRFGRDVVAEVGQLVSVQPSG